MWMCYKFKSSRRDSVSGEHPGTWDLLGGLDAPKNCFGDELYDHMREMNWIGTIDNYNCEGDEAFVAVSGIEEKYGDFKWEYHPDED